MERCTKRGDDGQAVMDCQKCKEKHIDDQDMYCSALYCRNRLKDRVAEYEDTGLEPQEILSATDMAKVACALHELNKYKELGDLDRLRELVEADRDGRCVVLPCKLHDKVFFIENGCVNETEVDSFHNWTSGRWKISTHTDRMVDHWKGYEIDFSGIGKTVFLTSEEAERALKGEQDG